MKLLHFADLHLGIENYGSLNPRTGLSTRVDDFLAALDWTVDAAIAEEVDAVLFAGDAFKSRDPNPTLQREFAARIRRLAQRQIPTVLLIGNHDLPSISARATAIDIYEALEIPGIYVARQIRTIRLETRSGPLQVVALPWVARSHLLTKDELRDLDSEELQRRVAEIISAALEAAIEELDPNVPAILVGHVSVEGARLGSEQSIMLGHELVLSPAQLHADRFDYIALGHIHHHQALSAHPPIVYAGSPERVDFGEEREAKGYVLVEHDGVPGHPADWTFRPLQARRFKTLRVTPVNEDPMAEIARAIQRQAKDIAGAIVRMTIAIAPEREELVRLDEVRRMLQSAGAAYVARVVREVEVQHRPRVDIRDDDALNPELMLERWLALRELPDEQRKRVQEHGQALIHALREAQSASS